MENGTDQPTGSRYCGHMSDETNSDPYEERAWQYFLQLQPSITDVNAAAELAFRAVDAFERELKRRKQPPP
jgi:hypothetical protein